MHDYLGSKYFAGVLVKQITEYWQQRGVLVDAWVEPIPKYPDMFQVRSNIRFKGLGEPHADGR